MGQSTKVHGVTIVASLAFHAALSVGLPWLALRSLSAADPTKTPPPDPPAAPASTALELPLVGEGFLVDYDRPTEPDQPVRTVVAGDEVARLDNGGVGRGGEPTASAPALNLADRDERLRLSPDLLSRLDRDQLQRLRVARARASWEDRRSTTHPAELTLVATGPGSVRERRPLASTEPSRGARESSTASMLGATLGERSDRADVSPSEDGRRGSAVAGGDSEAPGRGVLAGRFGRDHRVSAPVGSARPSIVAAPVSVPASDRARPRDNVESEQEVATTVQSLVHASTAGGMTGDGQGGSAGAGEAALGGTSGLGSRARPLGIEGGDVYDYWTSDPRLVPYFRLIHAKIDPLWADAFPKSALVELKQGTVILELTITAEGRVSVSWPPLRPSGVDEFDKNCAEAVRRAAPFPPIPRELGTPVLRIRAPFVANNPIIK